MTLSIGMSTEGGKYLNKTITKREMYDKFNPN